MSPPPPPKRIGWYQRLFARMLARSSQAHSALVDDQKRRLLGDLRGTVLEIGPGTGANLPYYAPGVHWIGVEPNPYMHPYLRREAARLGLGVDLRTGAGEQIDLPADSVDAVVSTLVLCSVSDVARTLQEIRRVLRPGGAFVFIEHVAAPPGTWARRVQRIVRPVWRLAADGCHPDRETGAAVERAGFAPVEYQRFDLPLPVVGPHIAGRAVKPETPAPA